MYLRVGVFQIMAPWTSKCVVNFSIINHYFLGLKLLSFVVDLEGKMENTWKYKIFYI